MFLQLKPALEAGEAIESYTSSPASTISSHRERDDAYQYVALVLSDKWRIASCRDGLQWIVQYRSTKDQWRSRKFFARASDAADWVRRHLGLEAYQAAQAWAQRHPYE
jgi:hypothetical protein